MEQATLRKLQLLQLQELKDVTAFCDRHGIRYFLDSGTLLGAVRHKGFIPWDDDVDICMDVKNYEAFLRIAHLLPERYYVQNFRTDPTMPAIWTKIRVNDTTVTPRNVPILNTHCGACMDIFAIAGLARSNPGRKLQHISFVLFRSLMSKEEKLAAGQTFSCGIMLLQRFPFSLRRRIALICERMLFLATQNNDKCFSVFYDPCDKDTPFFSPGWFTAENAVLLNFEGESFSCPDHYEAVLESYFGDWQTPPPPEQRTGHGDLIVDFDHGVEYYLNQKD
mgnify:FL=1